TGSDDHRSSPESGHVYPAAAASGRPLDALRQIEPPRHHHPQGVADAVVQGQTRRAGARRCDRLSAFAARPAMTRRLRLSLAGVIAALVAVDTVRAQVGFERILRGESEMQDWLTYSGGVMGQRHSPLAQITPANAKNLELQWVFQVRSLEKFEATPLVADGVMYTLTPRNDL